MSVPRRWSILPTEPVRERMIRPDVAPGLIRLAAEELRELAGMRRGKLRARALTTAELLEAML